MEFLQSQKSLRTDSTFIQKICAECLLCAEGTRYISEHMEDLCCPVACILVGGKEMEEEQDRK